MLNITSNSQSISQAIARLKADPNLERRIHLAPGLYKEQVIIDIDHLTIESDAPEETIISGQLYAKMPANDIGKLGKPSRYMQMAIISSLKTVEY